MLRLKHTFLLLLVLFLAACGTQAELPEAVATADEQLGQISAAELEQAFASSELSAQTNTYNKKKYNEFILKKVVEGYGPKDQEYKLAVICKVPRKEHKLKVVAAAYLKDGQYKHFYVPKEFRKCATFEFDYFGHEVKFKYENGKHRYDSGVVYKGKLHVWGKEREFKASKFFHVKHGVSKFITYNKYNKVEEPKYVTVKYTKTFNEHYEYLGAYDAFDAAIYCDDTRVEASRAKLSSGNNYMQEVKLDYKDLHGKTCYVKEYYYDDDGKYQLEKVGFYFDHYGKNSYEAATPHPGQGYSARSKDFPVDYYYAYVNVTLKNYLTYSKPEPKYVTVKYTKKFDKDYHLNEYDAFKTAIYCNDMRVDTSQASLSSANNYMATVTLDYAEIEGKHCYAKEYYQDNEGKYQLEKVGFYFTYYGTESTEYATKEGSGYSARSQTFEVKDYYSNVDITYKNYLYDYYSHGS